MNPQLLGIAPVLPSANIERDLQWYSTYVGTSTVHHDDLYAVLQLEQLRIHLQWHADTEEDPLLGGSVIKVFVQNAKSIFYEFVKRGTVAESQFREKTDWNTSEFGFYDLNNNALFFVEDLSML